MANAEMAVKAMESKSMIGSGEDPGHHEVLRDDHAALVVDGHARAPVGVESDDIQEVSR